MKARRGKKLRLAFALALVGVACRHAPPTEARWDEPGPNAVKECENRRNALAILLANEFGGCREDTDCRQADPYLTNRCDLFTRARESDSAVERARVEDSCSILPELRTPCPKIYGVCVAGSCKGEPPRVSLAECAEAREGLEARLGGAECHADADCTWLPRALSGRASDGAVVARTLDEAAAERLRIGLRCPGPERPGSPGPPSEEGPVHPACVGAKCVLAAGHSARGPSGRKPRLEDPECIRKGMDAEPDIRGFGGNTWAKFRVGRVGRAFDFQFVGPFVPLPIQAALVRVLSRCRWKPALSADGTPVTLWAVQPIAIRAR